MIWDDVFKSFFSNQQGSDTNKSTFGGPSIPDIPDWVKQYMGFPLQNGRDGEQKGNMNMYPNLGQIQDMFSQWPFSTMKGHPFSMFTQQQEQQGQQQQNPQQNQQQGHRRYNSSTRNRNGYRR